MGNNLIRNGGFERGDVQFWDAFDNSAFVADDSDKHRGTYSGKLTGTAADQPYIQCSDYIKIQEGDMFIFSMAAKVQTVYTLRPRILYYDENLIEVGDEYLHSYVLSTSEWLTYIDIITQYPEAVYFKIRLKQEQTGVNRYTFFDSLSLYKVVRTALISNEQRLQFEVETTGLVTFYGDEVVVAPYKEGVFELDVSGKINETGTLDVKIQAFDKHTTNWMDIATFNQVTTTLGEQILLVTAGLGTIIRAIGTVGGTDDPGFTWKVSGMFKP